MKIDPKTAAIAVLAVAAAYNEAVVHINTHRYKKSFAEMSDLTDYLAAKLDNAGIELDDFDKIAMKTI